MRTNYNFDGILEFFSLEVVIAIYLETFMCIMLLLSHLYFLCLYVKCVTLFSLIKFDQSIVCICVCKWVKLLYDKL